MGPGPWPAEDNRANKEQQVMPVADRAGSRGRITQVMGPVVDVSFEGGRLPEI